MFSVIVPCFNEESYIGSCLESIRDQADLPVGHEIEIIVAANGCKDGTVATSESYLSELKKRGFRTKLLDLETPGKAQAMNVAEEISTWGPRVFIDADVTLSEGLFAALLPILRSERAVFCSGAIKCVAGDSLVSKAYALIWCRLPFVAEGVSGVGLYGVSESGRSRWTAFPELHSDDRFVRLLFAPSERQKVDCAYYWPVPQGLWNLIQVRRRWNEGNFELFSRFPDLRLHDDKKSAKRLVLASFFAAPIAFLIFLFIWCVSYALARMKNPETPVAWRRGRP